MEVVGVVAVAARAEHRIELRTGAGERRLQEGPLAGGPPPPALTTVISSPLASRKAATSSALPKACSEMRAEIVAVAPAAAIGGDLP